MANYQPTLSMFQSSHVLVGAFVEWHIKQNIIHIPRLPYDSNTLPQSYQIFKHLNINNSIVALKNLPSHIYTRNVAHLKALMMQMFLDIPYPCPLLVN